MSDHPWLATAALVHGYRVLGPVVILAKVGQGGMGTVFRGHHLTLRVDVAVKCLNPTLVDSDPDCVRRFWREARVAARIDHHHVVRVRDVAETRGVHYLVMDYVTGETARQRVERKGPLDLTEALQILLGLASAASAAHAIGIVHRDIKPDNVMITTDGVVKLMDLGLARPSPEASGLGMSLHSIGIRGTPQYMPPEQWVTNEVGPAADVWAIGATFWFLLAGEDAMGGGSYIKVAERIRGHDFPPLPASRTDVTAEIRNFFARCVQRDPASRFQNATELLHALRALVDEDEVLLRDERADRGAESAGLAAPDETVLAAIRRDAQADGGQAEPVRPAVRPASTTSVFPSSTGTPAGSRRPMVLVALVALVCGLLVWARWSRRTTPDEPDLPAPLAGDAASFASARLPRFLDTVEASLRGDKPLAEGVDCLNSAVNRVKPTDAVDDAQRRRFAVALVEMAKRIESKDAEQAYSFLAAGLEWGATDETTSTRQRDLGNRLRERLRLGVVVLEPAPDSVVAKTTVRVRGLVRNAAVQALRVLVERADAPPSAEFARAAATDANLSDGKFDCEAMLNAERSRVRLLVEGRRGLFVELPPVIVRRDLAPPQVTVERPATKEVVPSEFAVSGRVTDASPPIALSVAGSTVAVDAAGAWATRVILPDGARRFEVIAEDRAGNRASTAVLVRVDGRAPTIDVPLNLAERLGERRIAGRVVDEHVATLSCDGEPVAVAADGAFELLVPLPKDGVYRRRLAARDQVGNSSESELQVTRCSVPPTVLWNSPAPDKDTRSGDVVVSGSVASPVFPTVQVEVNGKLAPVVDGVWRSTVAIKPGASVVVVVIARDLAGNEAKIEQPLRASAETVLDWAEPVTAERVSVNGLRYPREVREKRTGMVMVLIQAGSFQMGTDTEEDRERPRHAVEISRAFWLGKTEVTQRQWVTVMNANPAYFKVDAKGKALDDHPVEHITWDEARQFLNRLGSGFRLPTEAEWEWACNGLPWRFAKKDDIKNFAWCDREGSLTDGATSPVGIRQQNPRGLHDMLGNVWEWCDDTFDPGFYQRKEATGRDPKNSGDGDKSIRGGAWNTHLDKVRVSMRLGESGRRAIVGLRAARDL